MKPITREWLEAKLADCPDDSNCAAGVPPHITRIRITAIQRRVLEWFAGRDWTPHREWIAEMTTATPRALVKHGLLDVDHTRTTTHYKITDAGRAAICIAIREGGVRE